MSFDLQLDLTQLTNLVIQLERDDIQTADALLVRITGDYIGSRMLARLLYWFPRSVKQGWVYKSWRDWGAEVGISPAQIKRIHQQGILEQVGIQRRLMKANGAPTTHYCLDIDALLQKIATFLETTVESLRTMLVSAPLPKSKKRTRKAEQPTPKFDNYIDNTSLDNLPEPPWMTKQAPLVERIAEKTGLAVADLETIDEKHLADIWARLSTGKILRHAFFESHAVNMNDLILDMLRGVPVERVAQEMSWRARQPDPQVKAYSEYYEDMRQIVLTFKRE
jgi:hypothetical protein